MIQREYLLLAVNVLKKNCKSSNIPNREVFHVGFSKSDKINS